MVANPVRGLPDRKRSEEHLQSSNESKRKTQTNKNKNDKEKGTRITKYTCQKKTDEGHSIERIWHSASREPVVSAPVKLLDHFVRNRRLRAPAKPLVDRRRLVIDPQLRQDVATAVGRHPRANPPGDGDPTPGTKEIKARLEWRRLNGS